MKERFKDKEQFDSSTKEEIIKHLKKHLNGTKPEMGL